MLEPSTSVSDMFLVFCASSVFFFPLIGGMGSGTALILLGSGWGSPGPPVSSGKEVALHCGLPKGDSEMRATPTWLKEGRRNSSCSQLKGLSVVFQGEMGAPGARGDKGEKVAIVLLWPESLSLWRRKLGTCWWREHPGSSPGKAENSGGVLTFVLLD
ncbi:hypothetical protein LUU34_00360700 [Aix galericulata]|nr:hypothetical protein LUU34_00360700 [Aix galericulata]